MVSGESGVIRTLPLSLQGPDNAALTGNLSNILLSGLFRSATEPDNKTFDRHFALIIVAVAAIISAKAPVNAALASQKDMIIRRKYAIIFVAIILGLLAYTAKKSTPIPIGDAEDYWEFACGVELKEFNGYFPYAYWTGIFPDRDGWYFYYYQEHHGRHVFKVSKESLLGKANEVFSLLDNKIVSSVQEMGRNNSLEKKNKKRLNCLKIRKEYSLNGDKFVSVISAQSKTQTRRTNDLENFQFQWERSKIYWASILFEAFFLPFWWLFSFHSGVFGKINNKISVRLAFSPLILFTPHYLGYAPYLFSFGSSGGILYPLFAMLASIPFSWVPFNTIEIELLKLLPQPLSYISQLPASPMAISFKGSVSPSVLFTYAGIICITGILLKRIRANKKS